MFLRKELNSDETDDDVGLWFTTRPWKRQETENEEEDEEYLIMLLVKPIF